MPFSVPICKLDNTDTVELGEVEKKINISYRMDLKLQTSDYDAMADIHWTPKGQPLYVV